MAISWQEMTRVKIWIGYAEKCDAVFRVTGRAVDSSYRYRTDMRTIGPWEVIDQGVPFDTEEEARTYCCEYLQAVLTQNTVAPVMPHRQKKSVV